MMDLLQEVQRQRPELFEHATVPLQQWLEQFESDDDRHCALRLLSRMRFFTMEGVRQGTRALHAWLLAQPDVVLEKTRFTSFAKGKSGGLILYFYRTSNWLHHGLGLEFSDLDAPPETPKFPDADTLVIVDDIIGSGREADWYFQQVKGAFAHYRKLYFLALVGFPEGIQALREAHPEVEVHVLEEHHKLFSTSAFDADETSRLQAFLRRYGERVYPSSRYGSIATPFGYRDGQALVAFFYNTPSNTFPIFWSVEDGWRPLFQRFDSYNVPPASSGIG